VLPAQGIIPERTGSGIAAKAAFFLAHPTIFDENNRVVPQNLPRHGKRFGLA
jgi:hypothetical protein